MRNKLLLISVLLFSTSFQASFGMDSREYIRRQNGCVLDDLDALVLNLKGNGDVVLSCGDGGIDYFEEQKEQNVGKKRGREERKDDYSLDGSPKKAKVANVIFVLDGVPGVGKTTILKKIREYYLDKGLIGEWKFFNRDEYINDKFVPEIKKLHDTKYWWEPFPDIKPEEIRYDQNSDRRQKYYDFCEKHWDEIQPLFNSIVIEGFSAEVLSFYKNGYNVVVENCFTSSDKEFDHWIKRLENTHHYLVELICSKAELMKRIKNFKKEVTEETVKKRLKKRGKFEIGDDVVTFRVRYKITVRTDNKTACAAAQKILETAEVAFHIPFFKENENIDFDSMGSPVKDGRTNRNLLKLKTKPF